MLKIDDHRFGSVHPTLANNRDILNSCTGKVAALSHPTALEAYVVSHLVGYNGRLPGWPDLTGQSI